jgi:hypothetical protein
LAPGPVFELPAEPVGIGAVARTAGWRDARVALVRRVRAGMVSAAPAAGLAPGPVLELPAEPVGIGALDCANTIPADPSIMAAAIAGMLNILRVMDVSFLDVRPT